MASHLEDPSDLPVAGFGSALAVQRSGDPWQMHVHYTGSGSKNSKYFSVPKDYTNDTDNTKQRSLY
jgi:hypothetical protein